MYNNIDFIASLLNMFDGPKIKEKRMNIIVLHGNIL